MLELKDKLVAKSELQAGRVVQQALLPKEAPQVAGWDVWISTRPANEVGGDLVDFVTHEDGRVGRDGRRIGQGTAGGPADGSAPGDTPGLRLFLIAANKRLCLPANDGCGSGG
jgi:hypothetical protein